MDIYYAGAEQPVYLEQLLGLGVDKVAISFYEWQRRYSTSDLRHHIPAGIDVVITAGVARKETLEWESFAQDYVEFCEFNAERVLIYDMDAPECPLTVRTEVRSLLSVMPNVVMFPLEDEELSDLAKFHERIGVNARLSKSIPANELRRLPATLYGSNITDPGVLRTARFHATTTFSWLSGRRYGELWVFARNKLHHYSAENLGKAVRAHAADIEALGVDPLTCAANDKDALTQIAVRSIQAMSQTIGKRPRDVKSGEIADASANGGASNAMAGGVLVPVGLLSPAGASTPTPRDREMIPVIALNPSETGMTVESVTSSLRQCDSCYLSTVCPKYVEHSACSYEIPVEIRTNEQWRAATQVLLEIQFQRIAFGAFAEQLEGSGPAPRLGQEMDRFMKMLTQQKDLETPIVERGVGALSKAFGALSPASNEDIIVETGDDHDETDEGYEDYEEGELLGEETSAEEGNGFDGPPYD